MGWKTVREYADEKGISDVAVYMKIKKGKIQGKKSHGLTLVLDEDSKAEAVNDSDTDDETTDADTAYTDVLKNKQQLENDLKLEKLKNLRQDTLLKKQKQTVTKELYRQEYVEGVFDCFTDAFKDPKNLLIEMKLKKEQITAFQTAFKKALNKFENSLKKYLREKDKEEEQQNENLEDR